MLALHCVIHGENLVAKSVSPKLRKTLYSVNKCVNSIKANAKAERLFQKFCEADHAYHRQWLLSQRGNLSWREPTNQNSVRI